MSLYEYAPEYYEAQKRKIGPYYMFFVDVVNSKNVFNKGSFSAWLSFIIHFSKFCRDNGSINFNSMYGYKEGYHMLVGDGMAVMIDITKTDITNFKQKIQKYISKNTSLKLHFYDCYVETLNWNKRVGKLYYGYAFGFCEILTKDVNADLSKDTWWETIPSKIYGVIQEKSLNED